MELIAWKPEAAGSRSRTELHGGLFHNEGGETTAKLPYCNAAIMDAAGRTRLPCVAEQRVLQPGNTDKGVHSCFLRQDGPQSATVVCLFLIWKCPSIARQCLQEEILRDMLSNKVSWLSLNTALVSAIILSA